MLKLRQPIAVELKLPGEAEASFTLTHRDLCAVQTWRGVGGGKRGRRVDM